MALALCTPTQAAAGTVSTHRRSVGPTALADTVTCRPAAAAATAAHGRQQQARRQHVGHPPSGRGARQLTCSSYRTNPQNVDNPQASCTLFSCCGRSISAARSTCHAQHRSVRTCHGCHVGPGASSCPKLERPDSQPCRCCPRPTSALRRQCVCSWRRCRWGQVRALHRASAKRRQAAVCCVQFIDSGTGRPTCRSTTTRRGLTMASRLRTSLQTMWAAWTPPCTLDFPRSERRLGGGAGEVDSAGQQVCALATCCSCSCCSGAPFEPPFDQPLPPSLLTRRQFVPLRSFSR